MKSLIMITILILALLTGCEQNSVAPEQQASGHTESEEAADSQPEDRDYVSLPTDLQAEYNVVIEPLREMNQLERSWQEYPPPDDENNRYRQYKIIDVSKNGDMTQITLESYDLVIIDPETLREQNNYFDGDDYAKLVVVEGNGPDSYLPISRSVVTARRSDFGWDYLSCEYTPYENPGYSFLSSVTESIADELAKSEKPDLSLYDRRVVDHVYRAIAAKRFIRSPDEITMYDLNTFLTTFSFNGVQMDNPGDGSEPAPVESAMLRLMTGLTKFESGNRLSDYSVFEDMYNLERLTLYSMNDEDFATLRVGGTKYLHLVDADADVADLSGVKGLDTLTMQSWFAGVRNFRGCNEVNAIYIYGTRTDPRLYNPENFPNVKTIVIDSFRDYPRAVDYSRLAEFSDVTIDIQLEYYACDNAAIQSLAGVKLRNVYLQPDRGDPRADFDLSLVDALQAENLTMHEFADLRAQFYENAQ